MTAAAPQSTWSKILGEIADLAKQGQAGPADIVRLQKLQRVFQLTGRPLIVYAVACTVPNKQVPASVLMMDASDKLAFHDVTEKLRKYESVDVILHSPGGLAEAAEALVDLLRSRFKHVRFIIPTYAKSAATMLALSGDEILMHPDAELGPTDPQMYTPQGVAPAQSIIDQFEKAKEAIAKNSAELAVWLPILNQMGPSLLQQCRTALDLSEELVAKWLAKYMFRRDKGGETKAKAVASYLADHNNFKSHARGVKLSLLKKLGVNAKPIPKLLAEPLWEVYCAVDITFSNSVAARLTENHLGNRIVRNYGRGELAIQIPIPQPAQPPQPGSPKKKG